MGTKSRTNLDFKNVNTMLSKKKLGFDAFLFVRESSPKKKPES